ncbi:MAG TPA: MerR family transcriptional regulator [Streptosporangiaceae bacterium]|nr:MerR family transcriptional regulator [Streptosporangiaceae bacterium]
MSRPDGTWRIGELARETGLTVRALHHYDQLGLLSPLSRTEGGHRCYTSGDVRRLHRIVALRSLGISLEETGRLLDGEPDPTGLLRRQLEVVEERIRTACDLRARLLDALKNLGRKAEPSVSLLLQIIEETIAMNEPMTPTQFAELRQKLQLRARELCEEDFAALSQKREGEWNALSCHERERLTEHRRKIVPQAGGGTKGRS